MRASIHERYGSPDVLEIRDVSLPAPGPGEIRVAVHAATVGRTDTCALRAHPFFMRPSTGWLRPRRKILGLDFAGTVDAVGEDVSGFSQGDRVFGLTPGGYGAHAEFVCIPADGAVAPLPVGKRFDEVVVCEGAWYADTYLRAFRLSRGHRLLIYGASGAIGVAALQLAKHHYGAEVTAVVATRHLELARQLGADRVIDYTVDDFTSTGDRYDIVFDAVGKTSYLRCRGLLAPGGVFAATDLGPGWQNVFAAAISSLTRSGRVLFPMPQASRAIVDFVSACLAAGELRAVIDRRYPLDAIADAYRYVETQQKTGIVVIDIAPQDADR